MCKYMPLTLQVLSLAYYAITRLREFTITSLRLLFGVKEYVSICRFYVLFVDIDINTKSKYD